MQKSNEKAPVVDTRLELAELLLLRDRLASEGEQELLRRIEPCQKPLILRCLTCKSKKEVRQRCKLRWCPCCAKQLASARATEMDFIVERMRWPLFVTLTMKHGSVIDSADIRKLRRTFGKLRHRKIWKLRTRGGVAAVELTNDDGGWHPHLHAVIDCRWLAIKTSPPRTRATRDEWRTACVEAAKELGDLWAKMLDQPTASVRIKRANKRTIAEEVTKYTVKAQDLIESTVPIGPLIRSMNKTRLMTTFGEAHGQKVCDVRRLAKEYAKAKRAEWQEAMQEFDCCPAMDLMPEGLAENSLATAKIYDRRRVEGEPFRRRESVRLACVAAPVG